MTIHKLTLESLSNELLLDLFDLFDAFTLLQAFFGLNIRFNSLLNTYFRTYRVDFRSISKEDFHHFNSTYLPLIKSQIIYLRLSDDEDTPRQCSILQSFGFTLGQFENLRSLTFYCLGSDLNINQHYFVELHRLHQLTHLKFVDCALNHVHIADFREIIDQIWNLPKLTHLYWDINFKAKRHFLMPTCTSTSLQYLIINKCDCYSDDFPRLFEKTPQLKKLSLGSDSYEDDDIPLSREFVLSPQNLSITKLVLSSIRSLRLMTTLFQLLPNVIYLKVEIFSIHLDGNHWKEIITNYLFKLKYFYFILRWDLCRSIDDEKDEENVDQYLNTYRTSFWIEQHQWFVRCHWYRWKDHLNTCIYSLPYTFDYFPLFDNHFNCHTKSTCLPDMNYTYNSVRSIGYEPRLFSHKELSNIQLVNIEKLSIQIPMDQQFLSTIPNLENLFSLTVTISTENTQMHLQTILDCAPRLFSLSFKSCVGSAMPPYRYTSSSLRRLDVQGYDPWRRRHRYDSKKCIALSQSPLGIQCRILSIEVEKPKCILQLIYSMINLRTLHVEYENDKRSNQYDLVRILQHCLPSTWTITRFCYGHFILQS